MAYNELLEFISSLKGKLGKGLFPNEAAVSMQIVLPVLMHLNWDIYDSSYVFPQYPLEKLKVDFGLKVSRGEEEGLRCIIEVKAEGNLEGSLEATRQLFQYAFHAGAPLAVLTDGGRWRFYSVMDVGKHEERLVRTLELEKLSPEEVTSGLVRYLSFRNMISGEAWENAKKDLEQKKRRQKTNKNISKAWEKMTDGPSPELVDLLREETAEISAGFPPDRGDVEKFLKNLQFNYGDGEKTESQTNGGSSAKGTSFVLLNEPYSAKHPTGAFVEIMKILAERDPNFLPRLAPKTEGRKNSWLSKNIANIYREERDRKAARKLPGGWWLGTHASTPEKIKRLQVACEVAKIPFGNSEGLEIKFPSVSKKSRNRKK